MRRNTDRRRTRAVAARRSTLLPLVGPLIGSILLAAALLASFPGAAQPVLSFEPQDRAGSAVLIEARVPPEAVTSAVLGRERRGNGVAIDGAGLILTIGYLILEADEVTVADIRGNKVPATVIGYDWETGFGLVRAVAGLDIAPVELGDSAALATGDPVVALGHPQAGGLRPAVVTDKREFAGHWEYLLDEAVFTAPPHPHFGGMGLLDRDGRLVGIGSLLVADAANHAAQGEAVRARPGNMIVPIDILKPILADLIAFGRPQSDPRPWLGVNIVPLGEGLLIRRVQPGSPADRAGLARGDLLLAVEGRSFQGMAGFLRQLWAHGPAGTSVRLDVLRQGEDYARIDIRSADRYAHYRLESTY